MHLQLTKLLIAASVLAGVSQAQIGSAIESGIGGVTSVGGDITSVGGGVFSTATSGAAGAFSTATSGAAGVVTTISSGGSAIVSSAYEEDVDLPFERVCLTLSSSYTAISSGGASVVSDASSGGASGASSVASASGSNAALGGPQTMFVNTNGGLFSLASLTLAGLVGAGAVLL